MLIEIYSKLREKCDLEYNRPTGNNFIIREFNGIRWHNPRSKNFFIIIKVLAENGYCTINEIKDNDGLQQTPKKRKKRHDIYDRLMRGEPGKFQGLVDKWIVEVEDEKNWKIKRNNRYRLTLFGMLYAIHLFSEDLGYHVVTKYNDQIQYKIKSTTKYKKKILDVLVENYSDKLPLIFKRWDFMVSEFGTLVNFLVGFAHFTKNFGDMLQQETILSTDPIHMQGWESTDRSPSAQLSVLLFAWIAKQDNQYKSKFAKDKEILNLYKKYLEFIEKYYDNHTRKVKYKQATLYGKYDKARKIGIELLEGKKFKKGMKLKPSTKKWLENFDTYPNTRD